MPDVVAGGGTNVLVFLVAEAEEEEEGGGDDGSSLFLFLLAGESMSDTFVVAPTPPPPRTRYPTTWSSPPTVTTNLCGRILIDPQHPYQDHTLLTPRVTMTSTAVLASANASFNSWNNASLSQLGNSVNVTRPRVELGRGVATRHTACYAARTSSCIDMPDDRFLYLSGQVCTECTETEGVEVSGGVKEKLFK